MSWLAKIFRWYGLAGQPARTFSDSNFSWQILTCTVDEQTNKGSCRCPQEHKRILPEEDVPLRRIMSWLDPESSRRQCVGRQLDGEVYVEPDEEAPRGCYGYYHFFGRFLTSCCLSMGSKVLCPGGSILGAMFCSISCRTGDLGMEADVNENLELAQTKARTATQKWLRT